MSDLQLLSVEVAVVARPLALSVSPIWFRPSRVKRTTSVTAVYRAKNPWWMTTAAARIAAARIAMAISKCLCPLRQGVGAHGRHS